MKKREKQPERAETVGMRRERKRKREGEKEKERETERQRERERGGGKTRGINEDVNNEVKRNEKVRIAHFTR